jgi:hypothetical protein
MVSELDYPLQLPIIHNSPKCCRTNPIYRWLGFLLSSQLYNFSSPHKCCSLKPGIPFFRHLLSSQSPSGIFSIKPVPLYSKLKLPHLCLSLRGVGGYYYPTLEIVGMTNGYIRPWTIRRILRLS